MKKTILGLFAFVCAFSGISCSEDDLSGTSVIKPEQTTETPLDAWLYKNYIEPYNIEFRYRYEDMESDMIYDLTPRTTRSRFRWPSWSSTSACRLTTR